MSQQLPVQEQVQPKQPKEMTADEKAAQVLKAIDTGSELSDLDEFRILENKGIEYVLIHPKRKKEDLKIYVTPLSMKDHGVYLETMEKIKNKTVKEQNDIVIEFIAKVIEVDIDVLNEYVTYEDLPIITSLFACAIYEGKKLFKKKILDKQTYRQARIHIESAIKNHG